MHALAPRPVARPAPRPTRVAAPEPQDPLFNGLLLVFTTVAAMFVAWVERTPLAEFEIPADIGELLPVEIARLPLPTPVAPIQTPSVVTPHHAPVPVPLDAPPPKRTLKDALQVLGTYGKEGPGVFDRIADGDTFLQRDVPAAPDPRSTEPTFKRSAQNLREDLRHDLGFAEGGTAELGGHEVSGPVRALPPTPAPPIPVTDPAGHVADVLGRHRGRVQTCVERSLKQNPNMSGRVSLGWEIMAGRVGEVWTVDDTTGDPNVAACITLAVRTMRFDEGVTTRIAEFPLVVSGR